MKSDHVSHVSQQKGKKHQLNVESFPAVTRSLRLDDDWWRYLIAWTRGNWIILLSRCNGRWIGNVRQQRAALTSTLLRDSRQLRTPHNSVNRIYLIANSQAIECMRCSRCSREKNMNLPLKREIDLYARRKVISVDKATMSFAHSHISYLPALTRLPTAACVSILAELLHCQINRFSTCGLTILTGPNFVSL